MISWESGFRLLISSEVTLGKPLLMSGLQFIYLGNNDESHSYFTGSLSD